MIEFTKSAIAHIENTLTNKGPGKVFRLSVKASGCNGYRYSPEIVDHIQAGDVPLQLTEKLSVYIHSDSMTLLQGTVVDFVAKGFGQAILVFQNPNAKTECGCGESFGISEPRE